MLRCDTAHVVLSPKGYRPLPRRPSPRRMARFPADRWVGFRFGVLGAAFFGAALFASGVVPDTDAPSARELRSVRPRTMPMNFSMRESVASVTQASPI